MKRKVWVVELKQGSKWKLNVVFDGPDAEGAAKDQAKWVKWIQDNRRCARVVPGVLVTEEPKKGKPNV